MSVVKQNFVTLSGPLDNLDSIISLLSQNGSFIFDSPPKNIKASPRAVEQGEINPYISLQNRLNALADIAKTSSASSPETYEHVRNLSLTNAKDFDNFIEKNKVRLGEMTDNCSRIKNSLEQKRKILEQLEHLKNIDSDLSDFFNFSSIKVRFGYLPFSNYERLKVYLTTMQDLIFCSTSIDKKQLWGIYFTLEHKEDEVDSLMESLGFVQTIIPSKYCGNPSDSIKLLKEDIESESKEYEMDVSNLASFAKALLSFLEDFKDDIAAFSSAFETKRNIIVSGNDFTIYGWIQKKELSVFKESLSSYPSLVISVSHPDEVENKPPIVLKNNFIFRPFQNYVEMYGSPSYNEIDPTVIVALTYCLFFGIMFGDIGQGAVLIAAGFVMHKFMKMWLGEIIERVGVFSIIFGFVYGSVFGNEELLPGFKPNHNISTVLMVAVSLGAVIIILCCFVNIINGIKQKDIEKSIFSPNGFVGLIMYIAALIMVLDMMDIASLPIPSPVIITTLAVCLLLLFLREPIVGIITKNKEKIPKNFGEFFAVNFFELFEVILSFVTNTISFIRVGAFALSHAGMMTVVYLLAQNADGGHNPIVLILGNILVIALEGLIVGIQNLRLEFFELFSRFYDGTGRAVAKSAINKNNK